VTKNRGLKVLQSGRQWHRKPKGSNARITHVALGTSTLQSALMKITVVACASGKARVHAAREVHENFLLRLHAEFVLAALLEMSQLNHRLPAAESLEVASTEQSCKQRPRTQVVEEEEVQKTNSTTDYEEAMLLPDNETSFWTGSVARLLGFAAARTATKST